MASFLDLGVGTHFHSLHLTFGTVYQRELELELELDYYYIIEIVSQILILFLVLKFEKKRVLLFSQYSTTWYHVCGKHVQPRIQTRSTGGLLSSSFLVFGVVLINNTWTYGTFRSTLIHGSIQAQFMTSFLPKKT